VNHFQYALLGLNIKNSPSVKSIAYENLKDQEKLLLQEKEITTPSVIWRSHRRQRVSKEKNQKVRRTF